MSNALDPQKLRTVHLVPLTAYTSTGDIDQDAQAEHSARMYAAGIRVFLPAAGTSEFHSLSADEVVELVRITCESTGPDAVVFAPVGFQIGHTLEIGARSMEAGASGIMFMPFVHPYLSDQGAQDYLEQTLSALCCPALVYKKADIPSDDLLLRLADNPHVVGVKYAVNDMHAFRTVLLADGGRLEWLCGTAERFAPYYMLAGATGYTTGAGNLCPHLTLAMHSAFSAGEYHEGLRLQQTIVPIEDFRARDGDSYNVSMLKFGMSVIGQEFGLPRAPQRRLTTEDEHEVRRLLEPILDAEFSLREEWTSVGLAST